MREHRHLLIAQAQDLCAAQRVVAEQPRGRQLDPASGVAQGFQWCAGKAGGLARLPGDDVGLARQGLSGWPGRKQLSLGLHLDLDRLGAGALLQVHGIQHQQQGGDEGHRVDGPELVLQGNIAKPGTHGQVFSELSGNNIGKVPSLCRCQPGPLLICIKKSPTRSYRGLHKVQGIA
ncbi:hypothetical protein D3C76_441340 [compost metagenome]